MNHTFDDYTLKIRKQLDGTYKYKKLNKLGQVIEKGQVINPKVLFPVKQVKKPISLEGTPNE